MTGNEFNDFNRFPRLCLIFFGTSDHKYFNLLYLFIFAVLLPSVVSPHVL